MLDLCLDEQSTQFNDRVDAMNDRIERLHEAMRHTRWTVDLIALFSTIVTVHSMSTSSLTLGALLAVAELAP